MNDVGAGRLELDNQLWMQTVNDFMWSAPFGDAGQAGQQYNGPAGWLSCGLPTSSGGLRLRWSERRQPAQRPDLNGSTTEATFEST